MKYFPLVWSAIWRKPTEAVLIWLAVTASFTLFGFMVGLHAAFNGKHMAQLHDVFDLSVSRQLFFLGVAWALLLAIIGGFPPAICAARLHVVDALRAL